MSPSSCKELTQETGAATSSTWVLRRKLPLTNEARPSRVTLTPRDSTGPDAKAWRGNLTWLNRMRPQPWDDEDAGSHIGGLRSANAVISKTPGLGDRGQIIGRALDKLFTTELDVLDDLEGCG